jgi:hypothetical protein
MTNISAVIFIRHSSFVIFNPSKIPAPLFFIGVTHAPGGAPLRMKITNGYNGY